jgi:prepilin-type N-terminal cleavage/methylation domain-containing protein
MTPDSAHTESVKACSDAKGFTLIELAIVMVILGFLVSIGAGMMGPLTMRMKTTEAKENVNAAVDGVIGYAATNTKLPTLTLFPGVVRSQNDSWSKPMQYIVDSNLTASICDRSTTFITLRVCSDAACTIFNTVSNVAFIVLSPGSNYNNQTDASQNVLAARTINTYVAGLAVDNYAGDFTRATDEYDDIVKWVTLPELQTKLNCGRCSAYETYNNLAAGYFRVNGVGCTLVTNLPPNNLISSIAPGGSISGYTDPSCNTSMALASITYGQAVAIDGNRNCQVNYSFPIADK